MTPRELLEATQTDKSAMPLIMSLDDSVRELKEDLYNFKREVKDGMAEIRVDVAAFGGKVEALRERVDKNLAEYKAVASDMRADNARLEGEIKAIRAELAALKSWYLPLWGIIMTLIIAAIQYIK